MYKIIKGEINLLFSTGTKTTFMLMLLTLICVHNLYIMKKSVVISIDGNERVIVTFRKDVQSTLTKENIKLSPKDKITPNLNSALKDGDRIYIERAVSLYVFVDEHEIKVDTCEDTIADVLNEEGITLGNLDRVDPLPTEATKDGMKVSITRVQTQILKESKPLDFATVVKKNNEWANTINKVTQEGQIGEKEITFRVIFENGIEVSKKIIQELVTREPVEKVLMQGTLSVVQLSRGESASSSATISKNAPQDLVYKTALRCEATAYSSEEPGMGTITASGAKVKRDPNGYSTIAVDPRVIPLGTRVYVEGYGYAIAADTGGAIKGNKIDVYLNTVRDCINWGRRSITVYILS